MPIFFQTTKFSQSRNAKSMTIHCDMNLLWFPFDVQNCSFAMFAGKIKSIIYLSHRELDR